MRRILAILFALVVFVPLAACGSDDEDSSDDSSSSASSTEEEDEAEEEDDGDAEASGDFCDQAEVFAEDESLNELDFTDPDDVAIGVGLLEEFSDAAPDEISEDIDLLVEAFSAIVEVLQENEDDPEAQAAAFEALEDEFAEVDAATTRVEEFTLEACGVDISGGSSTGDTGDDSSSDSGEDTSLEDFADDVEGCEGGDMAVCDQLYLETPGGSEAETVARECGGEDPGGDHSGDCESTFG